MKNTYLVAILFITVFAINCGSATSEESDYEDHEELIFSSVLFRHGDRAPIKPYPTDPYNHESMWPNGFGQLTDVGKYQHLMLGRWLRLRYKNFLPDIYSPKDIYVRSSDVDRTLMSAQINLAGLYPVKKSSSIARILPWTPIPVHTIAEAQDYLLGGKYPCPRFSYEINRLVKSPYFAEVEREYTETLDYISKYSGHKITTIKDRNLLFFYDSLHVEAVHNKTLPAWTKEIFPDKLNQLAKFMFAGEVYNTILQRLRIGPLVREMVDHMIMKARGVLTPDRKLWMYSAHDRTIVHLLTALNLFEPHHPPYAAIVLVELWKKSNDQYFVTVSYKNTTAEPMILTLPECKEACPLDDFVRLTENVVPVDIKVECSMD